MTPQQRSKCMSSIKGKDTKPELIVRKFLFSKGLRYRLHNKKLPGHPDITLKKYKTVVFIDGCFWHGHDDCKYFKLPKSNEFYWSHKINHNKARDIANNYVLETSGWKVIRIWECEIKNVADRAKTLNRLLENIKNNPQEYYIDEPQIQIAADAEEDYAG